MERELTNPRFANAERTLIDCDMRWNLTAMAMDPDTGEVTMGEPSWSEPMPTTIDATAPEWPELAAIAAPYVPAAQVEAATAYGSIRASLTPAERGTLAVRLTSSGSANRALQGLIADATAGLPVPRAALLDAMTAATVITAARAIELA